ncbi:TetR family transcriptional regulator [Chamaesiphon sp. VAR_48_metabat_403]|uniref:IS1/IS1595 family N-terminal zinc-binding domain-containing protein n=1 Tax=Chamaesiphon sp. VAR_48_metabat_403 TaxID=2964700 RepID=UPI00286E8B13|nr:TetR family transcriptional regulator [Chamaesiphon sp. VAR_48_metabat_403]
MSTINNLRRQPQQKRGKQRVEKIIIAAAEVFAEAGVAAATIQQIADRASTAVGSIYQFFPDKLAIFNAIFAEHMRLTECIEADFFAQKIDRPLDLGISEYIDAYAIYFEEPIPRCIVVQYYLQPIGGMESMMADIPTLQSISIERHANFYRQRNSNLSIAKSELLSEVAHNIVQGLTPNALKSDEKYRQEIYAEIKDVLYGYLNPHIGDHLLQVSTQKMICPDCQSDRVAKNGRQQGKQRYICRGCGRQFLDRYTQRGYPLEIRQRCLALHAQGIGFREIERQTGVDCNTVINWVKSLESSEDGW